MFKERARLERTPSVWLHRGQWWLLQVLVPSEKLTEERHSVHPSPHVRTLVHVCNCESAPKRKRNGQLRGGPLWTRLPPYYLPGCCAGALWLLITTCRPLLAANFTKLFQSMAHTDRGGEGSGGARVTYGKWVALFCSFVSNVNFQLS